MQLRKGFIETGLRYLDRRPVRSVTLITRVLGAVISLEEIGKLDKQLYLRQHDLHVRDFIRTGKVSLLRAARSAKELARKTPIHASMHANTWQVRTDLVRGLVAHRWLVNNAASRAVQQRNP